MKTIEIIIELDGRSRLQTRGFTGPACRDAGQFLEQALGAVLSDLPTAELHQASSEQRQEARH